MKEAQRFPLPLVPARKIIRRALAEDLAWGDVTTQAVLAPSWTGRGKLVVKESGVVAGLPVAGMVFREVDPTVTWQQLADDGSQVASGDAVATIEGALASILMAERTALNFLQRMSGIATATARYVAAVGDLPARILDTRKTAPGLRLLDKYAVRMGGGHNHRHNLGDGILIKDNHLAGLRAQGVSLAQAIARARERAPFGLKIEVEVETVEQAQEALDAGAELLLLDNMSPEEMSRAVALARGRALTEASGGITLENVRAVAETGVDLISVGALTHSVKALDISLELE